MTKEAYEHLKLKADGIVISKVRYVIPEKDGLSIELDVFKAPYEGLLLAEVEFPSEEAAHAYQPPSWFGEDVTYSTEYRMQRKDGSLIWVWDTGSKSKNEDGRTVINSVIVDITEQRRSHDTIRQQQTFLQSLYDTMPCGLVQYSLGGVFLNANTHTFDLIGYTEEQFLAETSGSIISTTLSVKVSRLVSLKWI